MHNPPIRKPKIFQSKLLKFRNDLVAYTKLLYENKSKEASRLRIELNIQWGEVQSDLCKLQISRSYEQFGREFPIFETALQSPDPSSRIHLIALNMAIGELEIAIGKLNRVIDEGPPIRHSFWISGFVFVFILGWLVRHYQGRLLSSHSFLNSAMWADKKVWGVVLATVIGGIFSNLFTNIVWTDGWLRGIKRHPFQFFFYLLLALGLFFCAGKLTTA